MGKYTLSSFFAGIGGFDIAFERNGFETKFLCEINPFCNGILNDHWPNVQKHNDIEKVDCNEIPKTDVWTGGFPCQDISVARGASKRLGLLGSRSGLFYRFAYLISERKPQVVIIENVGGLLNSNQGRDFGVILQTMTGLGYAVSWRVLNSRYFGVPQSRTRVYICCWLKNPRKSLRVMFDKEGAEKQHNERIDFMTESNAPGEYPKVPKVAYCLAASSGRHTGTDWSRTYVVCKNGVRRMTPLESERLQGFPDNWTRPQNMANDIEKINTLRYTAIGNAVSVPVVEWIAKRVYGQLEEVNTSEDFTLQEVTLIAPELTKAVWNTNLAEMDYSNEETTHKWQKSGFAWGKGFMERTISPTPSCIIKSKLIDLIDKNEVDSSYYISPNAAEGILRRVNHQGRKLFAPLNLALETLKEINNE